MRLLRNAYLLDVLRIAELNRLHKVGGIFTAKDIRSAVKTTFHEIIVIVRQASAVIFVTIRGRNAIGVEIKGQAGHLGTRAGLPPCVDGLGLNALGIIEHVNVPARIRAVSGSDKMTKSGN